MLIFFFFFIGASEVSENHVVLSLLFVLNKSVDFINILGTWVKRKSCTLENLHFL